MSRKDYVAFAFVLAGQWACKTSREELLTVWDTTVSLATVLEADNERFDRGRFYHAVFGTDQWAARNKALEALPAAVQS